LRDLFRLLDDLDSRHIAIEIGRCGVIGDHGVEIRDQGLKLFWGWESHDIGLLSLDVMKDARLETEVLRILDAIDKSRAFAFFQ
jgi:hypothetical protein